MKPLALVVALAWCGGCACEPEPEPRRDAGQLSGGGGGRTGGGAGGGGALDAGVDAGTSAWRRRGVDWYPIPGTSLADVTVTDPFDGGQVAPRARVEAFGGLAADRAHNRLYLLASGGATDWAGNEVYELDLNADAPRWKVLRQPSPASVIVPNAATWADGSPAAARTNYALQFVALRHRLFRMSAAGLWGDGTVNGNAVDAFDVQTNAWDPAGTWAPGLPEEDPTNRPWAQDARTDDLFTAFAGAFRRWDAATGQWQVVAPFPPDAGEDFVRGAPSAVDTRRSRVLYLRSSFDAGVLVDFSNTPTVTFVHFTGTSQRDLALGAVIYDEPRDRFVIERSPPGLTAINPMTFNTFPLGVSSAPPDWVNGAYDRAQFLPLLKGVASLPTGSDEVWFLNFE